MAWHADGPDPDIIGQMNADFERHAETLTQRFTARDIGWVFPVLRAHEETAREGGLDELAGQIRGSRQVLEEHCEWGHGPAQSRALGGWHMAGKYGAMAISRLKGRTYLGYELLIYRPDGDELKTSHCECDTGPRFGDLYRKGIEAINNKKGTTNHGS